MTYLAAAFNSGSAAALHAVTTPGSYEELTQMHSEAVNLQLQYCTANANRGDYYCYFSHDYPASLHQTGHGASTMLVAPAENPGWYLYELVECG
jgi:curli biogenesis system outer membrane secretion channel CsgG